MKNKLVSWSGAIVLTLVFIASCNIPIPSAWAGSPWHWAFAMKQSLLKDAMDMPTALFIDQAKEHYYVVDSGKNRLLSFNRQGELLNILNAGKSLDVPYDMTRTKDGMIWVVEKGRNSLTSINLQSRKVTRATLYYDGRLIYPDRLEYAGGLFYVLDEVTGDIISYNRALKPRQRYSCEKCSRGFVDFRIYDQTLWALDQQQKTVYRFGLGGALDGTISLGRFVSFPVSLAVGPSGYLYILDRHKRDIAVYDKSGNFKYHFLRYGFSRGELDYPIEIRFDPWGGLCVVDEGNSRVEVFRR